MSQTIFSSHMIHLVNPKGGLIYVLVRDIRNLEFLFRSSQFVELQHLNLSKEKKRLTDKIRNIVSLNMMRSL